MTATMIAETSVNVDAEGFLTHADQWNEEIAEQIARENGIAELSERRTSVNACSRVPKAIRSTSRRC